MADVYLGLGSNLGDREAVIRKAVEMLDEGLGVAHSRMSSMFGSASWGFEGNDFLNCAVLYRTDVDPYALLDLCKEIETRLGRVQNVEYDAGGRRVYHDRPIDIDILLYGDERISSPRLTVPHPLMRQRDFVMVPLMEIYEGKDLKQ